MVPRFRFEQVTVELHQLRIVDMFGERMKSLAAAGFDQSGDEQAIDGSIGLLLANQLRQPAAVLARLETPKLDAAAHQQIKHCMEVFQFFVDDGGHFLTELSMLNVMKYQIQRRASRFLLAMRMVDKDFVHMGIDLGKPAGVSRGLEVQHKK
jgi:hypothetical protein